MDIYKGRETRHRAKNLAHATEYEFRLKVSKTLSRGQAVSHLSPCAWQHKARGTSARTGDGDGLRGFPVMIDSVNQGQPCSGVPGCCPQRTLAEVAALVPAHVCTKWHMRT